MKKLIASTLALTILATPLISSACFADTVQKSNIQCVQNENRSEPFKEKKYDPKRTRKTLAGVAAVTVAIAGTTVATLKHFEDKLPENLKAKLPLLFTKETQGDNESEKVLKDSKEGEDVETFTEGSNTAKDKTVEPTGIENGNGFTHDKIIRPLTTNSTTSAITNITTESVKEGKDETVEPAGVENRNGFTHDEIIRPLTTNNTKPEIVGNVTNNTNDTNNTNQVSGLKNTIANSAKKLAFFTILTIGEVFMIIKSQRLKTNYEIEAGTAVKAVWAALGSVGAVLGSELVPKLIAGEGAATLAAVGAAAGAAILGAEGAAAAIGAAVAGKAGAAVATMTATEAVAAVVAVEAGKEVVAAVAKILS